MRSAIIFIIALAVSGISLAESPAQIHGEYAAPFGLEWGMSKEQVTAMGVKLTPERPVSRFGITKSRGIYTAKTLPKNLPDAEEYELLFKQGFGLVKVSAQTRRTRNDLFGSEGKERYSQLKTAIIKKYGRPDTVVEQTGINGTYDKRHQFYECLRLESCGAWRSDWENKKDGYKDGFILLRLRPYLFSKWEGVVVIIYASAALHTVREQEAEERARAQKQEEEKRARADEERARADEDAL